MPKAARDTLINTPASYPYPSQEILLKTNPQREKWIEYPVLGLFIFEKDPSESTVFVCSPFTVDQHKIVEKLQQHLTGRHQTSSHLTALFSHAEEIRENKWDVDGMPISKEQFEQIKEWVSEEKLEKLFLSPSIPRPAVEVMDISTYFATRFSAPISCPLYAYV